MTTSMQTAVQRAGLGPEHSAALPTAASPVAPMLASALPPAPLKTGLQTLCPLCPKSISVQPGRRPVSLGWTAVLLQ